MNVSKWDRRGLELAGLVATWSKDPGHKVGCAIIRPDKTVAGVGYNGFPRGIADREDRLADRELKRIITRHAEENAIANSYNIHNATLYVQPLHPCTRCAGAIIQAGIGRVVAQLSADQEDWLVGLPLDLLEEAGVEVIHVQSS